MSRPGFAAVVVALLLALLPGVSLAAESAASSGANVPWYLSRATGLVAYLLLFCTVVLGLAVRTKALDHVLARWRVADIHIFLSILVVMFVAVHAAVLLGDTFVGFSVVEILVPFASPYRSVWTGLGIIAAYLLLIIAVSFPARRVIGYRAWRSLHYLTFAVYLGALVHGLFTGSDTSQMWAQAIYLSTAGVVLAFVLYRVLAWRERELSALAKLVGRRQAESPGQVAFAYARAGERARLGYAMAGPGVETREAPALLKAVAQRRSLIETRTLVFLAGAIGVAAVVLLADGVGPLRWGQASDSSAAPATSRAAALQTPASFSESYAGSVLQSNGYRAALSVHIDARGQRPVGLDLQVFQQRRGLGGAALGGTAVMTDASGATLCTGQVTSFTNSGFTVDCQGAGPYAGRELNLQGTITAGNGDSFQGVLSVVVASAGQE
ncbi:MAG TPA: ferric reductase-like transmembrane domain-containing protein [Dehalococcoidia bacterium]|nr:ferric reductase-like transmembrane domain-containing protein [Dehalococcoidia bacterium]